MLTELGLEDRGAVKAALCAVYAKSSAEQAAFRRAFENFFVSQDRKESLMKQRRQEAEELSRRRAEAEQELQYNGKPMDLRDELREVYVRMPEDKRAYLRDLMEKTKGNIERNPQLYSSFIHSVFAKYLLEQQMVMEDAAVGGDEVDPELGACPAGWPSGKSGRDGGGWCCCATCPAPCSSSQNSPCGSSSPCRRYRTSPGPSSSPRGCGRWTLSPCRAWRRSGAM